jgi:integrase
LLRASRDEKYGKLLHLYLGLVFNQGLSPSEALGLQTGDIRYDPDLGKNILSVQRGITKNREGDTKNTYRKRVIILRDEAKEYTDKLMSLARKKLSIWLFSNDDGMRLKDIEDIRGTKAHFNNKKNKYEHYNTRWYKLLSDCNIEHRHIKNCRHTFTMAMLDANIYSHTVLADMLGHSDLQMIIKHYAKSIKGKALEVKSEGNLYDDNTLGATLGATSENRVNTSSLKIV